MVGRFMHSDALLVLAGGLNVDDRLVCAVLGDVDVAGDVEDDFMAVLLGKRFEAPVDVL